MAYWRCDIVKAADLVHLHTPNSPTLAPDGPSVVFVLRTVDVAGEAYVSTLWRVSTEPGSAPVQFSQGRTDGNPRCSPDGRWLAFTRSGQLHVMPTDGGEPWPVTTEQLHPLGGEAPVWAPNACRIAYIARHAEPGRYGTGQGDGPASEPPRRITDPKYRLDGTPRCTSPPPNLATAAMTGSPGTPARSACLRTVPVRPAGCPTPTGTHWTVTSGQGSAGCCSAPSVAVQWTCCGLAPTASRRC
jgi:dipeptidyl aminopeptidase/acylaminoacyl peptidase